MNFKKVFTRVLVKASVLVFCLSLLFVPNTVGFFQDIEVAEASIETGTLDLGLRSDQSNFVVGAESMEPGDTVTRDIYVQNLGGNPFNYRSNYQFVSGDQDLCEGLWLNVLYNGTDLKYSGFLDDFDDFDTNSPVHDPDLVLPPGQEQLFSYELTLPSGSGWLLEKTCTFDIKTIAWQTNMEDETQGFWDEEVIESTVGTMPRCSEGKTAVDVAPIDRVNIGDELSENLHDIEGWSSPNLPGNYGGKDDGTYRQIIEETQCNDDGREAKFYLYAGGYKTNVLRIRVLDGLSNLDSFEVYVNGDLVGSYTDVQDSAEIWHTLEISLNNLSGLLEVTLRATGGIWSGCGQYGQVAVSWTEIDGYYCEPDEPFIPGESEPTCENQATPTPIDPLDTVNIGETSSETGHNMIGWSTENLPGGYGGKDDGTHRQVISEEYCSDEYRIAGFTLDTGSDTANLLRLQVLDGISGKDGFDVYVNDEFLAHLPDLSTTPGENWHTYEIPLPNLTGEIKVRLVAIDPFWQSCSTYGQVAVSWANVSGYTCGEPPPPTYPAVVINEVYYDVDDEHGVDGGGSQSDEWVELYNNTDSPVNLKNWTLTDNTSAIAISHSNTYIPAHGYAVIAKSANTWTFWTIPSDPSKVEKIQLGGNIGNGLANTGDRLILKNASSEIIDEISWGTDTTILDPSIVDVAEGHSIARITPGVDTDTAADWMDIHSGSAPPGPNPGTNPHSHIAVVLNQDENDLLISFGNASGFNKVRYSISYQHIFEGGMVEESITGEADKEVDEIELDLTPIYFGTCSGQGVVCTPHQEVSNVVISLMYKKDEEIVGLSTLEFDWENLE